MKNIGKCDILEKTWGDLLESIHFLRLLLFDDMLNMVIFIEGEGLVWQAVY